MNVCLLTYTEVFQILKSVRYQLTYITHIYNDVLYIVRALNLGVVSSYKTQIPAYQSTVSRCNIIRCI